MLTETKPEELAAVGLPPPAETNAEDIAEERPDVGVRFKTTAVQWILIALGLVAFLYFARPVVLPLFLACMASTALKPVMRWLSFFRIPTAASAGLVFVFLVIVVCVGFFQLGRPATRYIDEVPEHLGELRERMERFFPAAARMGRAVTKVQDLGTAVTKKDDADRRVPTVEIRDGRGATSILNWTGTFLAGLGEVLVLIYLILASGDMFMQKLVRVMPTLKDKKRAVEISHEVQTNVSQYLFTVTLINIGLGALASICFYFLDVPKPAMWGMLVAVFNFVPYFGPTVGVGLLAVVGILTFDSLWQALFPAMWYLALHLLESDIVTPMLLGRRFTLNPVAIFVSLMFWLWLWGVPGALISVPILVTVKAVCDRIPRASYISELIGR